MFVLWFNPKMLYSVGLRCCTLSDYYSTVTVFFVLLLYHAPDDIFADAARQLVLADISCTGSMRLWPQKNLGEVGLQV